MNTQRAGADNVEVRQAIQYAVDKQAFQVAAGGAAAAVTSPPR